MKKILSILLIGASLSAIANTGDVAYLCSTSEGNAPILEINPDSLVFGGPIISGLKVVDAENEHEVLRIADVNGTVAVLYDTRNGVYDLEILREQLYKIVGTTKMVCTSSDDLPEYD